MSKLTDAAAEAIEQRANAATKGPWHWHSCGEKCYSFVLGAGVSMTEGEVLPPGRIETERYNEATEKYERVAFINDFVAESCEQWGDIDFAFITHARQDIPALLADRRALRAELAAVTADKAMLYGQLKQAREHADAAESALAAREVEVGRLRAALETAHKRIDNLLDWLDIAAAGVVQGQTWKLRTPNALVSLLREMCEIDRAALTPPTNTEKPNV